MGLKPRREVIHIDVAEDYTAEPIWVVQGALQSLELAFDVTQSGEPLDLVNTKLSFKGRRSDGLTIGWEHTTEHIIEEAVMTFPGELLMKDGVVDCDITVVDLENGITVKTPIFRVHVLESITD